MTCMVLGCMNALPRGYLMCPDCWRCLPLHMKRELRSVRALGTAWKCIEWVGAWKSPLVPESDEPRWLVPA